MSKRSNAQSGTRRARRGKVGRGVIAALALGLVATAAAVTRLSPLRPFPAPTSPDAPTRPDLQLSKEYIYAGGRVVATEEPPPPATPTPAPAGSAPTALVATGTFPTPTTIAVQLTWSAPSSGAVVSYVVERTEARDAAGQLRYAATGPPVTTPPTAASPYLDPTAQAGKVYIYRAKAVFASGSSSAYSNQDLAATVRYTGDDPLVGAADPQGRPASALRASVLTELRDVVDSVRALAGLAGGTWRHEPPHDPRPLTGVLIRAWHFQELRSNLNPALSALGIAEVPADPALAVGRPVKAAHIQDVRDRVR